MKKPKSIVRSPKSNLSEQTRISTILPDVDSVEEKFKHLGPSHKLEIDTDSQKPQKTRTEHFRELEEKRLAELKDVYTPAALGNRLIAGVIDQGIVGFGCHFLLKNIPALNFHFYKLPLKNTLFSWYVAYVIVSLVIQVLPMCFFQTTLGKRLMKIKVRGVSMYMLSFIQILFRESIAKPLSLISVIGAYHACTRKDKMAIHDMISRTRVIAD